MEQKQTEKHAKQNVRN